MKDKELRAKVEKMELELGDLKFNVKELIDVVGVDVWGPSKGIAKQLEDLRDYLGVEYSIERRVLKKVKR